MSHTHQHDHCQHERVAFCRTCQRPYCKDCNKEWYQQSEYYYPWYQQSYISPWYQPNSILCGQTTSGGTATYGNTQTVAACTYPS